MRSPDLRVRRQLIEALLFEGCFPSREQRCENGDIQVRMTLTGLTLSCVVRVSAFGRIRLQNAPVRAVRPDGQVLPADWRSIVKALPIQADAKAGLQAELEQTVRLCTWNKASLMPIQSRRHLSQDALEAAIHEGHPYHPGFKARLGFSLGDHLRFGPESASRFTLVWLAIRTSQVRQCLPESAPDFAIRTLGAQAWAYLSTALHAQGASWDNYSPMPVHPWQWQYLSQHLLKPALARRDILHLGFAGDEYCATQSLRTLQNHTCPFSANIKLPLSVVNTSSLRNLAGHSVCTAPVISQWLQRVVTSNAFLVESGLVILQEYAGQLYRPDEPAEAAALDGRLGAIWRESLHPALQPDEAALSITALTLTEGDGRLFIHDWLIKHGLVAWLTQLIEVVVLPVWHLFVDEGIAVEAHAQNSILIHRNGWPVRLALRDFHDSVEYVPDFLKRPELAPDFSELNTEYRHAPDNRYYWMSSVEDLRELVMDTLFVFNLADLSYLLEQHYALAELTFWQCIRSQLLQHARRQHIEPARWTATGLDVGFIRAESLLAQKLGATAPHHLIPNALSPLQQTRSLAPCSM